MPTHPCDEIAWMGDPNLCGMKKDGSAGAQPTLATMGPSRRWGTRCVGGGKPMSQKRDMGHPGVVSWLLGDVGLHGLEARDVGEAVGVLEGDHPAGVLGREGADLIELLELIGGELEVAGGDVLVQLVEALGTDDH